MRTHFILYIIWFPVLNFAQINRPTVQKDNMLWFGYYNSFVLSSKWSLNSDLQLRTKDWYQDFSQALIRSGLSYNFTDKVTLTGGIAHFRYFITNTKTRSEHRPWQELAVHDRLGNFKISHRLRLEERFNQLVKANDPINYYVFNYRVRYKLDIKYPLTKHENGKNLILLFGDELMINAGKNITYNYFDQNRSYVGLNLELNKKITFQLQYMHIWQQLPSGSTFLSTEVIRFNLFHTLSL